MLCAARLSSLEKRTSDPVSVTRGRLSAYGAPYESHCVRDPQRFLGSPSVRRVLGVGTGGEGGCQVRGKLAWSVPLQLGWLRGAGGPHAWEKHRISLPTTASPLCLWLWETRCAWRWGKKKIIGKIIMKKKSSQNCNSGNNL